MDLSKQRHKSTVDNVEGGQNFIKTAFLFCDARKWNKSLLKVHNCEPINNLG